MTPEQGSPERHTPDPSEIKKIKVEDLLGGEKLPDEDGTLITLQVNARDIRDPESKDLGRLKPEAAIEVREITKTFFTEALELLTPEERSQIDIIVFASNARLTTPSGLESNLQRAVQTGNSAIEGIREVMERLDMKEGQLINNVSSVGGGPFEVSELVDLEILKSDEGYLQYLKDKYMPNDQPSDLSLNSGTGLSPVTEEALWVAYENDAPEDRIVRQKLGAEGPDEIAERVRHFIATIENFTAQHHTANPGRKVIVWAVGHYDNISPYLKKYVLHKQMDTYLGVDKNAGISIKIDPNHKATSRIKGQEFKVDGLS